jgi:hypothetical protein
MIAGILLSGKKFAGKDTAFEHIARVVKGRPVVKWKWATALRQEAVTALAAIGVHVTVEDLEDSATKDLYVPFLQWLGTDLRRSQDPDYWVKKSMDCILNYEEWPAPFWVNTDTRFVNEVEIPRQHGFICIRLEVSPETQRERAAKLNSVLTEEKRLHASETKLDGYTQFDAVIDTNRHKYDVWKDIDSVLVQYGVPINEQ